MPSEVKINAAIDQSLGLSGEAIYLTALQLILKTSSIQKILDFGAGQGRLLKLIEGRNFKKLMGVDLMPRPKDISNDCEWLQADLNLPLPLESESFDGVLAIEVIEHLENPRSTVREWKRLLSQGGNLIFSTPNCTSYRSLLALWLKGHFVSFLERDYPAHITALTKMDLHRILSENDFVEISFHYPPHGLIPGLRGLTWQKLSLGLLTGPRFSDNIFVTARKR